MNYNKKEEIWKDIPEYEGLYQASNLGKIKSLEKYNYKGHHNFEKILKQIENKNGYYYVSLCKNKKVKIYPIHKLIAKTFLQNPNNFSCINHKDGNKHNNCIENLEFCTYSHNEKEAYRIGLKKTIPTAQYDESMNLIEIFVSRAKASEKTGVAEADIWRVCKGIRKTAGGYVWRYADEI